MSYMDEVLKTKSVTNFSTVGKFCAMQPIGDTLDLIHAVLGMQDEIGEIAKPLKAFLFYGHRMDRDNLIEELGDLLYYFYVGCHSIGVSVQEVQRRNVEKLRKRYPNGKFNPRMAKDRRDEDG